MDANSKCKIPSNDWFRKFSCGVADCVGASWAFGFALLLIIIWGCVGPLFHFSDTWQLVINTATTIITFLMVFLIQNTQNRDAKALHLKLDELIRSTSRARNSLMNLENLTDDELAKLQEEFARLQKRASFKHSGEKETKNSEPRPTPPVNGNRSAKAEAA
jgi:low affinity Fe/Cu permease